MHTRAIQVTSWWATWTTHPTWTAPSRRPCPERSVTIFFFNAQSSARSVKCNIKTNKHGWTLSFNYFTKNYWKEQKDKGSFFMYCINCSKLLHKPLLLIEGQKNNSRYCFIFRILKTVFLWSWHWFRNWFHLFLNTLSALDNNINLTRQMLSLKLYSAVI